MKDFIFSKVAGCKPSTLLKMIPSQVFFKDFTKIASYLS